MHCKVVFLIMFGNNQKKKILNTETEMFSISLYNEQIRHSQRILRRVNNVRKKELKT